MIWHYLVCIPYYMIFICLFHVVYQVYVCIVHVICTMYFIYMYIYFFTDMHTVIGRFEDNLVPLRIQKRSCARGTHRQVFCPNSMLHALLPLPQTGKEKTTPQPSSSSPLFAKHAKHIH